MSIAVINPRNRLQSHSAFSTLNPTMPSVRPNIAEMKGYVPGEQPQGDREVHQAQHERESVPVLAEGEGGDRARGASRVAEVSRPAGHAPFAIRAGELLGVDPDWILCGNGSDDILTIVTRAFVGTSDMIRFANPSYLLYRTLAEIQGAACDIIELQRRLVACRRIRGRPNDWVRLAFLANPNSPSGTMVPPAEGGRDRRRTCPARCWSTKRTSTSPRRTACRSWPRTTRSWSPAR